MELKYLDRAVSLLQKTMNDGGNITFYGDYDVDGLACSLEFKKFCELLDYTNFTIVPYTKRTHNLDPTISSVALKNESSLCIICDTGSSELKMLKFWAQICPIILLDHHHGSIEEEDLDENFVVVNPTLFSGSSELSASCVLHELLFGWIKANRPCEVSYFKKMLCFYPFLSIYADGAYGFNDYCVNLYNDAQNALFPLEFDFAKQYFIPSRRFLLFSVAPPINAAFRNLRLDIINKLFIGKERLASYQKTGLVEEMMTLRSSVRDILAQVYPLFKPQECGEFILLDLTGYLNQSVHNEILWNNKGLIAGMVAAEYKKCCITIANAGSHYVLSCRDYYDRDILSVIKTLYNVNGHSPAFGGSLTKTQVLSLAPTLKRLSKYITPAQKKELKNHIPLSRLSKSDVDKIVFDNEFRRQHDALLISVPKHQVSLKKTPDSFAQSYMQYHLDLFGSTVYIKQESFDSAEDPYLYVSLYRGNRTGGVMVQKEGV